MDHSDEGEESRIEDVRELFDRFQRGLISRRNFVRGTAAIGGAAALQALLIACGGGGAPSGSGQSSNLKPQKLIYAGGQDAPTIDPSNRTDYSIGALSMQLYDRLFRYERTWPLKVDPGLCTSFSGSSDAREWVFHLDPRAKFHDGTPVTSEAVRFSFNRTLALKLPRADLLLPIMDDKSITTPDAHTVKMTLTTPYAQLPKILDQPIMNPKLVSDNEKGGDNATTWLTDHEAGSGPFTIKSWNVGTAYEMVWFDGYWQGHPGPSHLSGFVWQIVRESSSQRIGLIDNQFDVADNLSASDVSVINAQRNVECAVGYGVETGYTKLNNQTGPTADVNFRKFLAYAFDYNGFIKAIGGYGKLLGGAIPGDVESFDPTVGGYKTDLNLARQYLDKTKYAKGDISLDFVMVTGLAAEKTAGEIWLAQLKKFNIGVNIIQKVWPDIVSSCVRPSSAAAMNMIYTGYLTPDQWFSNQWYSPAWDRPTGGDFNSCTFTKVSQIDQLVEQVRGITDAAEQKKLYSELQRLVHDNVPDVPIYLTANIVGLNKRVQGYSYGGMISVDFWRLWIDDSKGGS